MRIVIACSSLTSSRGGTERAATTLAGEMRKRGHDVLLLSVGKKGDRPVYGLPEGVCHMSCAMDERHARIRHLREILVGRGIDVFLSMQSDFAHLFWSMVCMGSGIPFICSERCDPVLYTENRAWNRPGRLAVLNGADIIHELLPCHVASVPHHLRARTRVIANAAPSCPDFPPDGARKKILLFLARFDSQKRPLLLLEAFRRLAPEYRDWQLVFRGHGPLERTLKKRIRQWGLRGSVQLAGECVDVWPAYAEAQIYCLPSRYEGFPNTVLEAMRSGLAVAGIADCMAMRDLITDGENGLLADSPEPGVLAEALARLLADADLRRRLRHSSGRTLERYAPEKIFDQWEKVFDEAYACKGRTVMDSFFEEPFASAARLSAVARREWLYRNFGEKMPYGIRWWWEKAGNLGRSLTAGFFSRWRHKGIR